MRPRTGMMSSPALGDAFEAEMAAGVRLYRARDFAGAFRRFERAHVLGQRFVIPHTRTHLWMLRVGWRTRNLKEIAGQLVRIPGGIIGSAIGWVPIGNTGGSDVGAFQRMPIPDDLARHLPPPRRVGTAGER